MLFHSSHGVPGISNQNIWSNGKRPIASSQASPTAILPRPIFSRFTRLSFLFPSPSDACHAGYRALPGFNDLGHSVTPIFLSMDHFLYWFSTFREKLKKVYWLEVWIFGKMYHRIPFLLAPRASARRFQMPLKRLNFVKTLATFGIIYAADPLLQNMTTIFCLRWLTFDIYRPCSIIWDNFSKSV